MERDRSLTAHEEVVERALEWVAVAIILLNLPLSTLDAVGDPGAYVRGFADLILAALWALVLWAGITRARGRTAVMPLRLIVAVSCVALLLHPIAAGPAAVAYPPLLHVLGGGLAVSPIVGLRFSTFLIPLFAGYVAVVRTPVLGVRSAIAEAVTLALSAYLATVTVNLLRRANRSVVHAAEAAARAAELAVRAARRAYEQEHWNGVVHDKVLGALQVAVRADSATVPPAARELATQAVAAFRGDHLADQSLPAALCAHARLLGLDLALHVDGDVEDDEVRHAFVEAAKEALTNVARHAGTPSARIDARLSSHDASLTISDAGNGFDQTRRPPGRGIATSLVARMRAVHGDASVHSAPGAGTSVTLTWRRPGEQRAEPESEWQLRTFAPAMIVGGLALVMNVYLGAPRWLHDRSLLVSFTGVAAICAVTAAATWGHPQAWKGVPLAAAGIATSAALTANTPSGVTPDWRYWYLGALTPAIGAVSFRYRQWVGIGMATAMTTAICIVDAVMGRAFWACLAGPVPVLFAVAAAGQVIRAAMDKAWQRVTDAEAEQAQRRLALAVEEERSREAAARVAALANAVEPVMVRLAAGRRLEGDDRTSLALLENSIRDHLAVPDLLDAMLVHAIHEGRVRGVRVVVVPAGGRSGADELAVPEATSTYRSVLACLLRAAPRGAAIRAVWGSARGDTVGTITLVAAVQHAASDHLATLVASLPTSQRPVVTQDDAALLIEFPPSVTAHPTVRVAATSATPNPAAVVTSARNRTWSRPMYVRKRAANPSTSSPTATTRAWRSR